MATWRRRWMAATMAALGTLAMLSSAGADPRVEANWPQWRGPAATGSAPEAKPPLEWSPTRNVQWKVAIPGRGTATPIIWENQVFLQTAIPAIQEEEGADANADGPSSDNAQPPSGRGRGGGRGRGPRTVTPTPHQFVVLCLDRATGNTLWQKVASEEMPHEGHHPDHGYASYSPITDGQHVYAFFGSRGLYCYDLQGNLKWQKNLGQMRTRNGFGEGSSPALYENTLVINWDHEGDDFIVALDKRTGDELWRQERDEATTWSTPLILTHEGRAQVITAATNRIRSYDLETGELIWECEGLTPNAIPSPVGADGMVYLTSGFQGNELVAIRLGARGDLTGSDAIVWSHNRSTPYVPSPLLYNNRLYFCSRNDAILSCFEASSGRLIYGPERINGLEGVYASPVAAAGRIYLVGRNGTAVVLEEADELKVLATNRLDEPIDASPALAGNQLFLRSHEHLFCIAEPE